MRTTTATIGTNTRGCSRGVPVVHPAALSMANTPSLVSNGASVWNGCAPSRGQHLSPTRRMPPRWMKRSLCLEVCGDDRDPGGPAVIDVERRSDDPQALTEDDGRTWLGTRQEVGHEGEAGGNLDHDRARGWHWPGR